MGQEIALPALHQSAFVVSDKEPWPGLLLGQHRRPQEAVSSGLIGPQSKFFSNGQGTLKLPRADFFNSIAYSRFRYDGDFRPAPPVRQPAVNPVKVVN